MIGHLPGTPPGCSERSQNLPGELPRTLRALRGPSRTPRTSWNHETYGKLTKKQRKLIKRIRITENLTEWKETFKTIIDDRLHSHVTGHLPKKDRWQSTMQMKITPIICYMNLPPICPHCFKPGYEYTDVREYKKQPNKIAKTLKPSGSFRGRRQGVSL